ncbi:MAG: rane protein [Parcubacteria group bacterium]|nr:rane protein [Parcubacteria group bacterium]
MEKTTVAVFKDRTDAEAAINELRTFGIADADISYVYNSEGVVVTADGGSHVGDAAASGATTGAVLGAIAGLVVANGILPGLGTLFVAGPLAAALGLTGAAATTAAGAMTGLVAGGLVGALAGLGVSSEDAALYEERVKRGGILVTARSMNPSGVMDILKKYHAEEIREYKKA